MYKIQQSRVSEADKFEILHAISDQYTETGKALNFKEPVFDFSVIFPKKSGLSKKSKVATWDIWMKKLGLMVSHSKVPSSD